MCGNISKHAWDWIIHISLSEIQVSDGYTWSSRFRFLFSPVDNRRFEKIRSSSLDFLILSLLSACSDRPSSWRWYEHTETRRQFLGIPTVRTRECLRFTAPPGACYKRRKMISYSLSWFAFPAEVFKRTNQLRTPQSFDLQGVVRMRISTLNHPLLSQTMTTKLSPIDARHMDDILRRQLVRVATSSNEKSGTLPPPPSLPSLLSPRGPPRKACGPGSPAGKMLKFYIAVGEF